MKNIFKSIVVLLMLSILLNANNKVLSLLEDRGDMRDIKIVKTKPLSISYYQLGVKNDFIDVKENTINRGLLYGAIWSFYADNKLKDITITMSLKDLTSKKLLLSKTKFISRTKLLKLLEIKDINSIVLKNPKYYGMITLTDEFKNNIFYNSKVVKYIINSL